MHAKKKKKKKIILAALLGIIVLVLAGGIFWIGKNSHQKEEVSQVEAKIIELERQFQQLKNQLLMETDPTKKQELERKINEIKQQIKKLGGSNTSPTPNQNPPTKNPSKTKRQFTVENNGAVGGKWEFINVDNPQERILIDSENKIFYSNVAFYIKGDKHTISFNEEDAEKKGNNFVFDENNDKFQLMPISSPTPQTPPQPPNNNSGWINIEVKWGGGSGKKNYWLLTSADWPQTRKKIFISKKNVAVKGKKFAHKITPNLKIGFYEKDVSQKISDEEWLFDKDNNKFALTSLANWPDDPNYDSQIEEEKPKTVERLWGRGWGSNYLVFNNMPPEGIQASLLKNYWVHNDHPEIKRLGLNSQSQQHRDDAAHAGRKWIISFEYVDNFEHDNFYFEENNSSLEIKEEK